MRIFLAGCLRGKALEVFFGEDLFPVLSEGEGDARFSFRRVVVCVGCGSCCDTGEVLSRAGSGAEAEAPAGGSMVTVCFIFSGLVL